MPVLHIAQILYTSYEVNMGSIKIRAKVVIFVLLITASFRLAADQLLPEEKRALRLKPAVALVVVQFKTEWTLDALPHPIELSRTETGTGFFFRPDGYLITSGHVVADASKDTQAKQAFQQRLHDEFLSAMQEGLIDRYVEKQVGRTLTVTEKTKIRSSRYRISISEPTLNVILANGKIFNADILQYSGPIDQQGKDVAILKISAENLPTVPLGNSDGLRLQQPVLAMGYRGLDSLFGDSESSIRKLASDLEPVVTNGRISAVKTDSAGTPLVQSDVPFTHGESGGIIFNSTGEVIALATYGPQEVQGFNFLVPINSAMEFVHRAGIAPEQSAFDRHWLSALDALDAGKCDNAVGEFDNVQRFMPGLPDALRYRAVAVACDHAREDIGSSTPNTGIASSIHSTSDSTTQADEQRGDKLPPKPVSSVSLDSYNGSYYALVIGINRYRPPLRILTTAVNDAQAIARVLRVSYGFQVKLLINEGATRADILNTLDQYRVSLRQNDNLLIYYAGHGHPEPEADKVYWQPADADSGPANWIIADELTTEIRVLPARHVLVISDSCYSGGLMRESNPPVRPLNLTPDEERVFLQKMLAGKSRTLMASGGNEPVADRGADGHSVFANALLKALETTEQNAITAEDLFNRFVQKQVAGKSEQIPVYSLIRNSGHDSGDFVFVRP